MVSLEGEKPQSLAEQVDRNGGFYFSILDHSFVYFVLLSFSHVRTVPSRLQRTVRLPWQAPPTGWVKGNSDGVFDKASCTGGRYWCGYYLLGMSTITGMWWAECMCMQVLYVFS